MYVERGIEVIHCTIQERSIHQSRFKRCIFEIQIIAGVHERMAAMQPARMINGMYCLLSQDSMSLKSQKQRGDSLRYSDTRRSELEA